MNKGTLDWKSVQRVFISTSPTGYQYLLETKGGSTRLVYLFMQNKLTQKTFFHNFRKIRAVVYSAESIP